MNDIKVFENPEFGEVRTTLINGEPWFVGKDVANALGFSNSRDAIKNHVFNEDKGVEKFDTPGGVQQLTVINESGIYSLIFNSRLPNAKKFKHWVTSEVLPAIRKTGSYDIHKDSYMIADPVERAKKWIEEETVRKEQAQQIEAMKPKALFADSVTASDTTILVGELAKVLKGNGVSIGQNRLFVWMRENGYLINRKGSDWNMPTQKAMELGLFKVKETVINHSDGSISISKTVKVTGKGQLYFVNKFLQAKSAQRLA
ncbi:phage antirepressor [Eubacterium pyruvativorans]|uniref:phage antirepressor n=1 Tax=Eubacterium pyruvativorans TaxID=155865 RepID=UPI0015642C62|nr:phage antirepressor KilAC domain-containing protein [Eubacterium pyruvativorans]